MTPSRGFSLNHVLWAWSVSENDSEITEFVEVAEMKEEGF